jgi:hypothetical protein
VLPTALFTARKEKLTMPDLHRRSLLGWLLVLPFSGKFIAAAAENSLEKSLDKSLGTTPPESAPYEKALNVVRIFNTLEA